MASQQSQLDVVYNYINLVLRRYRLIVVCLLLAVTLAYPFYLRLPDVYQSSSSIIYQEGNINPTRLSPDEEIRFEEMVNTVTQQVLSRKNLEQIITRFDLYPEMRQRLPIENVMRQMREKDVEINLSRESGNVFRVSFRGGDPEKVQQITNALAARFIEENMRMREERVKERATYIRDELQMSKETLREKEAQMRDYKQKYYNEMPEQRPDNMSRLNSMQERLQEIQANIHDLEQTRLLASEQLALRRNQLQDFSGGGVSEEGETGGGIVEQLAEARSTRQELLERYTEVHPSVKRIEKRIARLEAEFAAGGDWSEGSLSEGMEAMDGRMRELSLQLKSINLDLVSLRQQRDTIARQIRTYQRWIDAAPRREAEWSALTRDYEELKNYHDELVSQSLAAEAAESLEQRQKGSRFKIIDPAFLPQIPVKGSFLKILLLAAITGLAAGGGLVLVLDFIETSFKDEQEIESTLRIPVTCTVPLVLTGQEEKRHRRRAVLWNGLFLAWAAALTAVTIYLYQEGHLIL